MSIENKDTAIKMIEIYDKMLNISNKDEIRSALYDNDIGNKCLLCTAVDHDCIKCIHGQKKLVGCYKSTPQHKESLTILSEFKKGANNYTYKIIKEQISIRIDLLKDKL